MNRTELETRVSERTKISPRIVSQIMAAAFDKMKECFARGEHVRHSGFGSFIVQEKPPREIFNPHARERARIGSRKRVVFRPSQSLLSKIPE